MGNEKRVASWCGAWLLTCAAMVLAMAVIGAITRLTESGLSITEWKPFAGALPPLNAADWAAAFDLYQKTPEYIHKNAGMSLADFKQIFFWEWFHRLWGRLIGVVFALPLIWMAVRRAVPQGYGWAFLGVLVLGGLQGAMGWYMVQSGLVDRPAVSHYRLAAHLGLAFVIYAVLLRLALDFVTVPRILMPAAPREQTAKARLFGLLCIAMLANTIVWGAFTAGLDAGLIYNTFPLMGGHLLPQDATFLQPLWMNFVESHAGVQFMHRWLATGTGVLILAYAIRVRHTALAMMVVVQVGLGIATLLSHVQIALAATHQAGAFMLAGLLVISISRSANRGADVSRSQDPQP